MIGIYKITSPSGKIYIGQSIDIERRFRSYNKLSHCKQQIILYNSFIKYGVENHIFEVIEQCETIYLNERERYWQDFFDVLKKGLNCKLTNTKDKSGKMSDESKIKMSKKLIGNKKTLGLKRSEKQKKQISERMKGNIPWNLGIKRTKIELLKMSENRKGKMTGEDNYNSNLILNTQTGIFYFGIKEACKSYDGNYHSMRDRLSNKTKNKTYFLNV
jgi:group I intron endonuclease